MKTIIEIAKALNTTPYDVWRVMAGEPAPTLEMATVLSKILETDKARLIEKKNRLRLNALDYVARYCGFTRTHAWRVLRGRNLSRMTAKKLEEFSGIPYDVWMLGDSEASREKNWMLCV